MNLTKNNLTISLVIPLFNNDKMAQKLLPKCYEIISKYTKEFEIILCNDGSNDRTLEVLKSFSRKRKHITIINHKKNLGITKSIYDLYMKSGKEYILLFSVDGGWNIHDITKLIMNVKAKNADILIGQRLKKEYSKYRHLISFLYNYLPKLLFSVNTYDAGSIKIFRSSLIKDIGSNPSSVFFEAEMIIRAKKRGFNVQSIPVTHKKVLTKTGSGVNLSEVIKAFKDMLKLKFNFNNE